MLARASAFGLLAAAALADSSGAHSGAFYFLLAALPVLIVGELMVFGDLVEAREIESKIALAAQAFLSLLTLALVLVIVRSSAPERLARGPMRYPSGACCPPRGGTGKPIAY